MSHARLFKGRRNRIASCERGQEGKEIHRPPLSVCGVRARTSADSGYAFLFARSLLGVVSKQADVDLAMMGERKRRTHVHG